MTKKKLKSPKQNFGIRDFHDYVLQEMERTGKTKEQIIEETFHDGWLAISETDAALRVDTSQLFKGANQTKPVDSECKRLRSEFGPISKCIDYWKQIILGDGIDISIDHPKDKKEAEFKEELLRWMKDVYQDAYLWRLLPILDIMLDEALTTGYSAAEIVYETKPNGNSFFDDYTTPIEQSVVTKEGKGLVKKDMITYETRIPNWTDLKGIARLKIIRDAITRLKLYRTPSWEANYWTLDEPSTTASQILDEQTIIAQSLRQPIKSATGNAAIRFLPWQIFSLGMNRRSFDEKGTSIILPALKISLLLEKILNAVGEGMHRAGNKKFFIVCGTEKRPWSAIHIRNLLSQLKDASEKGWSTLPVPAGFDLKEAGGTVFEAQNVIDYFLRIIAGTMGVPSEILGIDSKENAKTEVPHYIFTKYRNELKTALETQLFRLQIWTKFGAKKDKQGGHKEPQYIPDARIKVESSLDIQTRLNLDIQCLNVANPLRPQVKLEIERDIVQLSCFDVYIPSQDEYEKEMKKAEEEMKKNLELKAKNDESKLKEVTDAAKNLAQKPEGEKFQGEKKPPDEEQLSKRLEGGMNVRKVGSKKGRARPMTQRVEETQTNPQKLEITVKTEPQVVKTEVTVKTPLDEKMSELAELESKAHEAQRTLAEEDNKRNIKRAEAELERIQTEIKAKQAEINKLTVETEESKKTHAKKREAMERIIKEGEN